MLRGLTEFLFGSLVEPNQKGLDRSSSSDRPNAPNLRHTVPVRRGSAFLLGVLVALLAAASARATGVTTTDATTTTTATTTTPSYAPLSFSSLPAGCVGAGAVALLPPSHPVIALGTPATSLGPSAYPSSGSVVSFDSAAAAGSTCTSARVTLSSVSMFGGVVTASSVQATNGRGTAAGVEIDGVAVAAAPGTTVHVEDWGQLTFGGKVGRVTAPLVLRLLQAHGSLSAGTAVAVAFGASAKPAAAPKPQQLAQTGTHEKHAAGSSRSGAHPSGTQRAAKDKQPRKPPPDYRASAFPFLLEGGLAPALRDNSVVSTAMRYLGVPYQWGGASPKAGFDCSGLVTYVFAKLGVALPHYAAAQYYSPGAVWVSPKRLQPGDLVFFIGSDGTRKMPGHVGIYVDDGYFIDAPHTGAFVRIDSLSEGSYANEYVAAKRIVGGSSIHRRLLDASKDAVPAAADPLSFSPQMTGPLAGESLPQIAAVRTAARAPAAQNYGLWTGVGLAGLLVLSLGGTLTYRRRRPAPDSPT
jgi:cell wall-associated NlpC family hydrolase